MLATIGSQIGQVIERERAEAALREAQAELGRRQHRALHGPASISVILAATPDRESAAERRRNWASLMMRKPEIWREIALYFLATVFAFALGIVATVALQLVV